MDVSGDHVLLAFICFWCISTNFFCTGNVLGSLKNESLINEELTKRFVAADVEPYHKVFGKIDELNYERWSLKLDIAFSNIDPLLSENEKRLKTEVLQSLKDENAMMYSNLLKVSAVVR